MTGSETAESSPRPENAVKVVEDRNESAGTTSSDNDAAEVALSEREKMLRGES